LIGPLIDRRGGRELMVVGALITGAGLAAIGLVQTLWRFYLVRGLVVSVGMLCMGSLVVNVVLANWFVRLRGRAVAFAAMGVSVAAIVLPPLTQWSIEQFGWRATWGILGARVILLVTAPAALIMRWRPEDMGLHPDGDSAAAAEQARAARPADDRRRRPERRCRRSKPRLPDRDHGRNRGGSRLVSPRHHAAVSGTGPARRRLVAARAARPGRAPPSALRDQSRILHRPLVVTASAVSPVR
jgi:MFS family permease